MFVNPSSAVISKARSKYGRRITDRDYKALIKCSNVAGVVNYLKNHTHYSDILNKINETEVHRGQLETLIKQKIFYDFDSLCRYEMSEGSPFSDFIIRRYEIEQLVHFLLLLSCNKVEEYIYKLPTYFNKHTHIDLYKLSQCRDFDSFIQTLGKSEYKKILEVFTPDKNGVIDVAGAEDAMNVYSYKELYVAISKRKSKKEKENLLMLCDSVNDFCNISRVLRLKKYYSMTPQQMMSHLLPYGTIKTSKLQEMCDANTIDDVFEIISTTRVGKRIKHMDIDKEEQMSFLNRYNMCRKQLYYSQDPAVVLLSYMYLSEAELKNIITVIEGVRYQSPKDMIESLLIR